MMYDINILNFTTKLLPIDPHRIPANKGVEVLVALVFFMGIYGFNIMARPQKNNADYFSHDNNMRNHRKIKAVRNKYHLIGYAIFNMFLETLTEVDDFKIKLDTELEWELLAADFGIETIQLKEIVNYLVDLDLLQTSTEKIYQSKNLLNRFNPLIEKRQLNRKNKNGVSASEMGVSASEMGVSASEMPQSKVNKSKVNKTPSKEGGGGADALTPAKVARKFFNSEENQNNLAKQISEKKQIQENLVLEEIKKFISYWTELTKSGKQQRWELEPTFEIPRRLGTWFKNVKNFSPRNQRAVDI